MVQRNQALGHYLSTVNNKCKHQRPQIKNQLRALCQELLIRMNKSMSRNFGQLLPRVRKAPPLTKAKNKPSQPTQRRKHKLLKKLNQQKTLMRHK